MEKGIARQFTCLMADYLDIPSFVCEKMESQLINGNYEDVINFVVKRKKEIEDRATVYIDMMEEERKKTTGVYKDKKDFREKRCQMCGSFVCSDINDEYADGCAYLKNATFEKDE